MAQQNLLQDLETVLHQDQAFISDGTILKNAVIEAALKMDPKLLALLLQSEPIKAHFFTEVAGVLVFDKVRFQDFVSNKAFLPDSYTAFRNRIGLTTGRDYISQSRDVVLSWPYKDCVLEGGMTKEDQGRNEVFWNSTLAPDDITRLFEPKVLTGWERWDTEAVKAGKSKPVGAFQDTDNLLVKGNNLFALHSLKARYAGRVKLIYIDPPYNTDSDSFRYNDRFNHSSWLTFMKNRLNVAWEFLARDGLLAIQCDDNEQAYLKVLCDELFAGAFLNCVVVKMSEATGVKMAHVERRLPKLKEYILLYKKSDFSIAKVQKIRADSWNNEYKNLLTNFDEEKRTTVRRLMEKDSATSKDADDMNLVLADTKIASLSQYFKDNNVPEGQREEWKFENAWRIVQAVGAGSVKNYVRRLPVIPQQDIASLITREKVLCLFKTDFDDSTRDPRIRILFADDYLYTTIGDLWADIKTTGGIGKEGGVDFPNGKKPERLIERLIGLATFEGDLVMDFFAGSGTTAAVAQKMNRRWIAIEQLDYASELPVERIKNVLAGDQTGISVGTNWEGGGSFVYAELAAFNLSFAAQITDADGAAALLVIYEAMQATGYLRHDIDLSKFDSTDFAALPLADQKRVLTDCLDANHLYVNLGSLGDEAFQISEEDAKATRAFYGVAE